MNEVNLDYGKTPIKKIITTLAIPSIITMIISTVSMIIDGYFTGNYLGSEALAAVNLVMPILMIVIALFDIIASGSGIRTSILLGENKNKHANQIFSSCMSIILILSILVSLILLLVTDNIIFSLIENQTLATLAYDYIKIFIYFMPLIIPMFVFDNFLLIQGKAKTSMIINITVAIINIFLNWLFIGYLGLGITFAALSTVISMTIGSILSIIPFFLRKTKIKFVKPSIKLEDLKMIIYNGSSNFFESISGSILAVLMNAIMLSIAGANGIAAISILQYIEMLLTPIIIGIIISIQPVISYNYGALKKERIKKIFNYVAIITSIVSVISTIVLFIFPEQLVGIFADDKNEELLKIATISVMIYAPSYLFSWFNSLVGTFLTAFEKPKLSIILMLIDSLILPIILFVILTFVIGVYGIALAFTISTSITFVVAFYMWKKVKKELLS